MELRQPTGADCVWYQELLALETPPNAAELVAHFAGLTTEEVEAMPSKDVWPLWRKAQDAIMEGFPSGEAD